ncbi:MAG: peptidoglycan DD-metalloendopeptidase family protein [Blautia sp.]
MQNMRTRLFMKKHGPALVFSLCLVGAAAFTTVYTLDQAESTKEQEEQTTELEKEARIQDANAAKKARPVEETAAEKQDARVSGSDLIGEVVENPEDLVKQVTETDEEEETGETASVASSGVEAAAGNIGTVQASVQFSEDSSLDWPVAGNVLLDYSMDGSVFFPTLKVYKYNPALIIGADIGSPVAAAAKGIVDSVKVDEETGTTVAMNIGNGYELTYGQLKEVSVKEGDVVEDGGLIGYVSEPTKYYCEEGSNLYFKLTKEEPVDPFLFESGRKYLQQDFEYVIRKMPYNAAAVKQYGDPPAGKYRRADFIDR